MKVETGELLSIGRFARLSGLTVKALRHYDDQGLLEPAHVDEWTGYRYYTADQARDAIAIRRLRELELPLDEIAAVLRADPDTVRERRPSTGRGCTDAPSRCGSSFACSTFSSKGRSPWCRRQLSRPGSRSCPRCGRP